MRIICIMFWNRLHNTNIWSLVYLLFVYIMMAPKMPRGSRQLFRGVNRKLFMFSVQLRCSLWLLFLICNKCHYSECNTTHKSNFIDYKSVLVSHNTQTIKQYTHFVSSLCQSTVCITSPGSWLRYLKCSNNPSSSAGSYYTKVVLKHQGQSSQLEFMQKMHRIKRRSVNLWENEVLQRAIWPEKTEVTQIILVSSS